MTSSNINKKTGKRGEEIAVSFLKKKGYTIVEQNYRCVFGEIDIVARHRGDIVFIEVKSRKSENFGNPEEAVGFNKQRKMSQIALNYLNEKRLDDHGARFDVVAVKLLPDGNKVKLFTNAFELAY
ncbi:MAG: YraN family protein [Deltaproteobacteria bacterium]|nr:YraN family protein [Deltaproteobacteria bacterium]